MFYSASAPTAFGTRNTGPTLAAACSFDAGSNLVHLDLTAAYVRLQSILPTIGDRKPEEIGPSTHQPQFLSLAYCSDVRVQSGQGRLLSAFILDAPQPTTVVFLLQAVAQSQPAPSP